MKLLFLTLLSFSTHAFGDFSGTSREMYPGKKPWFHLVVKESGAKTSTEFIDSSETVLSQEEVELKEGKLFRYDWKQKQSGDQFYLRLVGNEWLATFNGKNKKFSRSEYPDLIVPPMIAPELLSRVKKNPDLKEWEFELLVPDKLIIISFIFRLEGRTWNLTPKNFFIRAVVGTISFDLNAEGKLSEIRNFTPPVRYEIKKNSSWETRKTNVIFNPQK